MPCAVNRGNPKSFRLAHPVAEEAHDAWHDRIIGSCGRSIDDGSGSAEPPDVLDLHTFSLSHHARGPNSTTNRPRPCGRLQPAVQPRPGSGRGLLQRHLLRLARYPLSRLGGTYAYGRKRLGDF